SRRTSPTDDHRPGLPKDATSAGTATAPVEELVVTFRLFHLPSGRARARSQCSADAAARPAPALLPRDSNQSESPHEGRQGRHHARSRYAVDARLVGHAGKHSGGSVPPTLEGGRQTAVPCWSTTCPVLESITPPRKGVLSAKRRESSASEPVALLRSRAITVLSPSHPHECEFPLNGKGARTSPRRVCSNLQGLTRRAATSCKPNRQDQRFSCQASFARRTAPCRPGSRPPRSSIRPSLTFRNRSRSSRRARPRAPGTSRSCAAGRHPCRSRHRWPGSPPSADSRPAPRGACVHR